MEMRDDATLVDGLQMEEELCMEEPQKEDFLLEQLGMRDKSDESLPVMRALAQKGDQSAILWMGMYYMQGEAQERDIAEACYWLNKSSDTAARARMAQIYEQDGNMELAAACAQSHGADKSGTGNVSRQTGGGSAGNAPGQGGGGSRGNAPGQGGSGSAGNAAGEREPAPKKKGFWNRLFRK